VKKVVIPLQLLYYVLIWVVWWCFASLFGWIFEIFKTNNLITMAVVVSLLNFFGTMILAAVMMRFSLLKWYVDPFAAAVLPIGWYLDTVVNTMMHGESFLSACHILNVWLLEDSDSAGSLMLFSFVFALFASFSFARVEEQSISYRILNRAVKRTK